MLAPDGADLRGLKLKLPQAAGGVEHADFTEAAVEALDLSDGLARSPARSWVTAAAMAASH
jgi:hypothetical protein